MVPGPGGIAIACFPDGTQEIPGLTNDAVANHADGAKEAPADKKGVKRPLKEALFSTDGMRCQRN